MLENERNQQTVEFHLHQALAHLEMALDQSVQLIQASESLKKTIGPHWEAFLGEFIGYVRDKGKQSKINLLSFISFPRMR
jgi:hypothetical protein